MAFSTPYIKVMGYSLFITFNCAWVYSSTEQGAISNATKCSIWDLSMLKPADLEHCSSLSVAWMVNNCLYKVTNSHCEEHIECSSFHVPCFCGCCLQTY